MRKKILITVLIIFIGLIGFTGYIILQSLKAENASQTKRQYDQEVISPLKRPLDFSPYEEALSELTDDDIQRLHTYIFEKTIEDIQKSIIAGHMTCEETVLYYIHRIKDYDSHYNTVIQLNPNALELAKKQDKSVKSKEKLGRLFGAMVLLKDNIADMTMNTASGAYALKDLTTNRDAFIVTQLKNADAIILGKANLSEWSNFMSMPSSNGFSVLGGQTKNAYGRFDVGGSSSGSSVSASLNFATVTIGSETSGSLIYPAGQNSVVALKPTVGLLSRDLIIPISEAQDTAGIIGKTTKDVLDVFSITLAFDKHDPQSNHVKSFNRKSLDTPLDSHYLKGKRLGIIKEDSERYKLIKQELESLGAEIINIDFGENIPEIDMMSVLNYGIVEDLKTFLNHPDVNTHFKSLDDILAYNKEDPENRMPYGATLHENAIQTTLSKKAYEEIVMLNRSHASSVIDQALTNYDIIAIVSFSNTLSGIYAPAMYPALTVPAGYSSNGEPLGVTFVGSLNDDVKLLNIGYCYEQATQHRTPPTLIK